MVNRFNKNRRRKNNLGGFQNYRRPPIFSGGKIKKEKKKVNLSPLSFKKVIYISSAILLIYLIFFSHVFVVSEVIIEGNNAISDEKINSYVPKGKNIFLFSTKKIRQKILNENTEIKDVEIMRGIPNAIKVVVLEYENKLIWQTDKKSYLISTQGIVTKQISETKDYDLPMVVDKKNIAINPGDSIVSPNFIAFVNNIDEKFFEVTNIKPKNFEVVETTFDVNLKTEAGFYVKLNTMRASAKQLDNLKKVLVAKRDDIHEYVDLRIDGWAYYK